MDLDGDGLSLRVRRATPNALLLIAALFAALLVAPWVASIASAEQQQQVIVCERQWYCAWLCKKCHTETRWCYNFSSLQSSCRVVYESLHGCELNKEYAWTAVYQPKHPAVHAYSLFSSQPWRLSYTACSTGITQCFANRLTSTGACGASLCSA